MPYFPSGNLIVKSIITGYTLTQGDQLVPVDSSVGTYTVTFPAPAACPGKTFRLVKDSTDYNLVTFSTPSGKIGGVNGQTLVGFGGMSQPAIAYTVSSDGTNWQVIGA